MHDVKHKAAAECDWKGFHVTQAAKSSTPYLHHRRSHDWGGGGLDRRRRRGDLCRRRRPGLRGLLDGLPGAPGAPGLSAPQRLRGQLVGWHGVCHPGQQLRIQAGRGGGREGGRRRPALLSKQQERGPEAWIPFYQSTCLPKSRRQPPAHLAHGRKMHVGLGQDILCKHLQPRDALARAQPRGADVNGQRRAVAGVRRVKVGLEHVERPVRAVAAATGQGRAAEGCRVQAAGAVGLRILQTRPASCMARGGGAGGSPSVAGPQRVGPAQRGQLPDGHLPHALVPLRGVAELLLSGQAAHIGSGAGAAPGWGRPKHGTAQSTRVWPTRPAARRAAPPALQRQPCSAAVAPRQYTPVHGQPIVHGEGPHALVHPIGERPRVRAAAAKLNERAARVGKQVNGMAGG